VNVNAGLDELAGVLYPSVLQLSTKYRAPGTVLLVEIAGIRSRDRVKGFECRGVSFLPDEQMKM
jgi:hypothetical protein